jgi:hypothetical protein
MIGRREKSPATTTNQKKHVLSSPDQHVYPKSKKKYIHIASFGSEQWKKINYAVSRLFPADDF